MPDAGDPSTQIAHILLDLMVAYEVGGDPEQNERMQNLTWDRIAEVDFTAILNPDGRSAQLDPRQWLASTQYLLFLAVHELAGRAGESVDEVVAMLREQLEESNAFSRDSERASVSPRAGSKDVPSIVRSVNVQGGKASVLGEEEPQAMVFLGVRSVPPGLAHVEDATTTEHHYAMAAKTARQLARLLREKGKN